MKNLSMENFSFKGVHNNEKTKSENTVILGMQ